MCTSRRSAARGSGSGGASPSSGGVARCTKSVRSVGGSWASTRIGPPGAARNTTPSRCAVNVRRSPGGESGAKRWAAFTPASSSPRERRRAAIRLASSSALSTIAASARASPLARIPRMPTSAPPRRSKATSSARWRPSGSRTSRRSPAQSGRTVAPPPRTTYRSVPGGRRRNPGSSTRGLGGLMSRAPVPAPRLRREDGMFSLVRRGCTGSRDLWTGAGR